MYTRKYCRKNFNVQNFCSLGPRRIMIGIIMYIWLEMLCTFDFPLQDYYYNYFHVFYIVYQADRRISYF